MKLSLFHFLITDNFKFGRFHPALQRNPILGGDRNRVDVQPDQANVPGEEVHQTGCFVSLTKLVLPFDGRH